MPSTFKAEARFRVKTKVPPEATNQEQFQSHLADVKKYFLSRLWNLRGWRSSVVSVLVSCFNSQFFDSEIGKSSAESEIMRGMWFSGRQVKIVSQNKQRGEVLTLNRPCSVCNEILTQQKILFFAFYFQS